MKYDVVVVGAGFAGAVMARRYAEEQGMRVLVVEKRDHIGGHAHDEYNEHGVLIHTYGPHIFHTNNSAVWKWLGRFTEWNHYQHRVLSYVDGTLVPMPISSETINSLFGENLTVDQAQDWLKSHAQHIPEIRNSRDVVLAEAGQEIYDKLFKNYTFKQWNKYPEELSPDIIKRIPIRNSRDTRYFTDKYQGIPKRGYTEMFRKILNHRHIHVILNANWFEIKDGIQCEKLVYTGPIDHFFNSEFGELEYRSLRFEYETLFDREFFQTVGTVNYPNDYDFTRISEYKHLSEQTIPHTTIVREYPSSEGEPFYAVLDDRNRTISDQYRIKAASIQNVQFIGRLAEYRYYNMDTVVQRALEMKI